MTFRKTKYSHNQPMSSLLYMVMLSRMPRCSGKSQKLRVSYVRRFGSQNYVFTAACLQCDHPTWFRKPVGMAGMLKAMKTDLEGRHHSGIDDCKNIAKIVERLRSENWSPLVDLKWIVGHMRSSIEVTRYVLQLQVANYAHAHFPFLKNDTSNNSPVVNKLYKLLTQPSGPILVAIKARALGRTPHE